MTSSSDHLPVTELIDIYFAAWNDPDATARARHLDRIWDKTAVYVDPTVEVTGAAALLAHIDRVRQKRPGARLRRTSIVDHHHDLVYFSWQAEAPDGQILRQGIDVAEIAENRKLKRIIGFFGPWDEP